MSIAPRSRRHILGFLLSTAVSSLVPRRLLAGSNDQGIGGTGVTFSTDDLDRGIGGTGVIGTIRKFGSIIVNDLRIAYPPDAEIRIDGRPASAADLRIGQVVRVAATGARGALSTRTIDVTSEVVGLVERIAAGRLVVLGQTVSTASVSTTGLKRGDTVAVSGLRRNDGTIVASLVERRAGAASRVAGPVDVGADGSLKIGGLALSGVNPDLIGRRAVLEGRQDGGRFVVAHGTSEAALLPPGITTLSVESYVARRGNSLALGSGFAVEGVPTALPAGQSVRAILTTSVSAGGRLVLDGVRSGGRTYGVSKPARPGRGDEPGGRGETVTPGGGRVPMQFGGPQAAPGVGGPGNNVPSGIPNGIPGGAPGGGFEGHGFGGMPGGFGGGRR